MRTLPRRDYGIDVLRTLAILAMMAAHTTRLIEYDMRWSWSYFALLLEPLIPTLFLTLVGISLAYSFALSTSSPRIWYQRQCKRGLMLWVISGIFFALEEGFRFPDVLVASGILCTIAYSLFFVGGLLALPKSNWLLGILWILGVLAFYQMDHVGKKTFLLLSGNSPLFPLVLFALSGALWVRLYQVHPRWLMGGTVLLIFFGAFILVRQGLEPLFTNPLGRSDARRILLPSLMPMGGEPKEVLYYNLRPLLALFCLSFHFGALAISRLCLHFSGKWTRFFLVLGRHSLEIYMFHLFCLGAIVVLGGKRPLNSGWKGTLVLMAVMTLSWSWALWRESKLFRKTPAQIQ